MKKLFTTTTIVLLFLNFSNNISAQFVNIPDVNFKTVLVANLSINTNGNSEIEVSEASAYTGGMFVGTQSIADLTGIEAFTALTQLDVSQNSLSSVDLSANVALTNFNCSFNSLTCLDLSLNPALTALDCSNNLLSSLNVKNGNNAILANFNSTGNSPLSCIQVDNASFTGAHDTWSFFSTVCGPQPVAAFNSNAPVCFGTPVTFTDGSSNGTNWHWDFGDGYTSLLTSPTHTYLGTGGYIVSLIVGNCNGKDTFDLTIDQGKHIVGNVTYSGGPMTGGTALLLAYQPIFISFDTIQIAPVDLAGDYSFYHMADGDYIIKIFPDTFLNPTLLNTYYTSHWAWDSASVLIHGCYANDTANITMVEEIGIGGGIGLMQGVIVEGFGFGRTEGDPVHGVDVKLGVTGTAQMVSSTTTDLLGQYSFPNLAFGNYTVYVDIPGLERDSVYSIVIDASNNQYLSLNYSVDSASVYVLENIGINEVSAEDDTRFNIYPNPVKDHTTIEYAISSGANIKLDVYNAYGVKIQSLVNTHLETGEYIYNFNAKANQLKPGVYFISLSRDGKTKTRRMIILE